MSGESGDHLPELVEVVRRRRRDFGRFLRSRRLACRMTQQDVADLLAILTGNPRITRSEVSRYERGKRLPNPPTLRLLAIALNVPLGVLEHHRRQVPYGLRYQRAEPGWTASVADLLEGWKTRHGDLDQLSLAQLEELRRCIHRVLTKAQGDHEPRHAGPA